MLDKSNDLIKEIFNYIYEVRQNFLDDNKDLKDEHLKITADIKKVTEMKNQNKLDARLCQMRVEKCEKDVGYHLLGDVKEKDAIEEVRVPQTEI